MASKFSEYMQNFKEKSGLSNKEMFSLSSVSTPRLLRILQGHEPSGKELIHLCIMIAEVQRRPVQLVIYEVLRVYVPRHS